MRTFGGGCRSRLEKTPFFREKKKRCNQKNHKNPPTRGQKARVWGLAILLSGAVPPSPPSTHTTVSPPAPHHSHVPPYWPSQSPGPAPQHKPHTMAAASGPETRGCQRDTHPGGRAEVGCGARHEGTGTCLSVASLGRAFGAARRRPEDSTMTCRPPRHRWSFPSASVLLRALDGVPSPRPLQRSSKPLVPLAQVWGSSGTTAGGRVFEARQGPASRRPHRRAGLWGGCHQPSVGVLGGARGGLRHQRRVRTPGGYPPPPPVVPHPREDGPPPPPGGPSPSDGPPSPHGEPHYHRTRTFAGTEIAA